MKTQTLITFAAFAASCAYLNAQPRQAAIVGGGNPDWGRCSAEILVDGSATVEIQGGHAVLRDVSGAQPQWRRFECTSPLPANIFNTRLTREEGRGRIEMLRDPRNGIAVIRMDDPQGGANVYSFELVWNNREGRELPPPVRGRVEVDRPRGFEARGGPRFSEDEAIRSCQDAIRTQVADRFPRREIEFRRTVLDDAPGRVDYVTGRFSMRRANGDEFFHFTCAVDFGGRRVREAHFEPVGR